MPIEGAATAGTYKPEIQYIFERNSEFVRYKQKAYSALFKTQKKVL